MMNRLLGAACLCAAMFLVTGCPGDNGGKADTGTSSGKDAACVPNCTGKVCGDDGCGGTCTPGCASTEMCENGACKCKPNCDGKFCGDDGCGGSCAPGCAANQECTDEGTCRIKICIPNCDGKDCGTDGCGGFCGDNRGGCPEGKACSVTSKCELCTAQCDVDQECGEDAFKCSCGSCQAGLECKDKKCVACTPNCAGKDCGDDGCGGTCGTCASGTGCSIENKCIGCTPGPECAGKACGFDAKGCSCGTCTGGEFCQRDRTCAVCPDTGGSVTIDTLCTKLDNGLHQWAAWNYQMCGMPINDADPAQLNSADVDYFDAEFGTAMDGSTYPVGAYNAVHNCQNWLKEPYEALKASAKAGNVCFDSKAVDQCIQAGIDLKKQGMFGASEPEICSKFFVANAAEGKACSYHWECKDDMYCKPADEKLSCGGVCAKPLAEGTVCGPNDTCAKDTECRADTTTGTSTCVALPKLGESCAKYDCASGLVCDATDTCIKEALENEACVLISASYFGNVYSCASEFDCVDATGAACTDGATCTCVKPPQPPPPLKYGETCDPNADDPNCDYCLFCNPDTQKCDKPTKIGDACMTIQGDTMCVDAFGLQECVTDETTGTATCKLKPRQGVACTVDTADTTQSLYVMRQGNCMYNLPYVDTYNYCKRTAPDSPGICSALPKKGEACNNSFSSAPYCQDGYCKGYTAPDPDDGTGGVDGTCVDFEPDGTPCALVPDLGSGVPCSTVADCEYYYYYDEECIDGVCTLPPCTTDGDCRTGEMCDNTQCVYADPYICQGTACVADTNGKPVCGTPMAKAGELCAVDYDGNLYCEKGAYCAAAVTDDAGAGPMTCFAKKAGGEPCSKAAECASGTCGADKVCMYDCSTPIGSATDGCGDYTGFNWWSKFIFVSGTLVLFGLRRRRFAK